MNGKSLLLEKAGGDKGVAASLLSQMFILSTPAHGWPPPSPPHPPAAVVGAVAAAAPAAAPEQD